MARLDYVTGDGEVAERIRARRGGRLTPLDGMLLHSPPFADGWNSLLGAIRGRSTLPGDVRELAILRVAELNGAGYEWSAHEPVAKDEGLTTEQIAALRADGDPAVLDPRQRAALAYTDAMTRQVAVGEELFRALGEHFDDRQVVELTVTVGAYNMVSRFLVALEVGR
ncbi:AhpD family alkylhydroperoxidase [Amycolatopsis bartoniae]|uniref:Carboxymuconolactone decarboxylase n=1 Tax=Amycolatopsis bartoniae TaxID=941986 RepID=A0A8H9J127_9PSEU|nr:carboxymuconolactone decarboxylase family protein [Amycolatopsis bartoniae]MBB2936211.1 AhpD family alkylhydroperoxidase [Amycolatopsis bartoniae]TVT07082.1 carboxymuconolactone decarboxylase family protein [Amycolatopsis bartoniae]GHF80760.1 carboxymuconolactone decarboxylase [Amycolatopsis bartoniae]